MEPCVTLIHLELMCIGIFSIILPYMIIRSFMCLSMSCRNTETETLLNKKREALHYPSWEE